MNSDLKSRGWTVITDTRPILELALELGEAVPCRAGEGPVSVLRVQQRNQGHPNSLSSRFGIGRFPFHTDGAHFPIAPKYVLMRLVEAEYSETATELLNVVDERY